MQLKKHSTPVNEVGLAERIKRLIEEGHCIESVERHQIEITSMGDADPRFLSQYRIESLTVDKESISA